MKILMIISNGFEETEAVAPYDILKRAGVNVDIYSITGDYELTSTHNMIIKANQLVPEVVDKDYAEKLANIYDGIVLPGGQPNAGNLQKDSRVISIVRAFNNLGKVVSAICAAPCVLQRAGIVSDKRITSYPGCVDESDCREFTGENVVRDGNIVTGKAAGCAIDFGLEILKALGMNKESEQIKEQIFYNFV